MPDRQTGRQLPAPSRAERKVSSCSKGHTDPIDLHNALLLAVGALCANLDEALWENSRPEVAA